MEINGKIYRNLEGQVGYLTDKYGDLQDQINDLKGKVVHYIVVATLPTENIDTSAVYLVGPKGTAPVTYYEEWVYVEISEGIWSWEKLGDTASIDLSNYLEKVTTTTVLPQVYVKNADGTQGMFNVGGSPVTGNIPIYLTDGKLNVGNPTGDSQATPKKYVDDNFVAKQSGSTPYDQAYGKNTSGSQIMWNVDPNGGNSTIALRLADGRLKTGADPTEWNDVVIKHFADEKLVAKVETVTTYRQVYAKNPDGSQYMQVVNGKDFDAGVDRIACYGTDGRLRVGEPVHAKDAATKGYVDATVGQLIYKHQITLNFTVSSKLFQLDIVVLNGTSTAYTSTEGRQMLANLRSSSYSISTSSYVDNKFWSVAICPSDKYIHDDTGIGFLLTAGSDGTTIYVNGIDPNYNANITGVSISDVVTTW